MNDKAYFISDLHLGSETEPNALLLLKFLTSFDSTQKITHLFLVGDIFDLWIAEHSYFQNKFRKICNELKRISQLGVEIHYFEGNHDLYLQPYFADKLGLRTYISPQYFQLCQLTVRVEHGDEMDLQDTGYILLRKVLRSRFMTWLAPLLPESFVVWLGERMSKASRKYTSEIKTMTDKRAKEIINSHVERTLKTATEFDVFVSGHIHVVQDENREVRLNGSKKRVRIINLGSWFDQPKVLVLDNQGIRFQPL